MRIQKKEDVNRHVAAQNGNTIAIVLNKFKLDVLISNKQMQRNGDMTI